MTPLMPEYERQLRAAARRLAGDPAARAKASHVGPGSRLFFALTGVVAVAVVVAVAAIVLIGHPGPLSSSSPRVTQPTTQYDCAARQILRTRGQLVPIAHGTVGGHRWTLQLDSARRGLPSVQAGRFVLGGSAYAFCDAGFDMELVNAGPHGIVYGLAPRPYRPPIVIEATTAHGSAAHPVHASNYPATTRQLPDATLFVRALPASACAYREVAAAAHGRPNQSAVFFTKFTRSCAPGQLLQSPQRARHR